MVRFDRDVAEIAAVQAPFVGDRTDDRARADPVPLADRDAVGGEPLPRAIAGAAGGFVGPVLVFPGPSFGRRLGRQQEGLAITQLRRERRGDIGHRNVVLAFVIRDQTAEQLETGGAEAVGDRIGEFRHPLCVDVVDAGQLSFGELLPGRFLDCLEQMTRKAQVTIAALSTLIIYVSLNSLARTLRPASFVWYAEDREEGGELQTCAEVTDGETGDLGRARAA